MRQKHRLYFAKRQENAIGLVCCPLRNKFCPIDCELFAAAVVSLQAACRKKGWFTFALHNRRLGSVPMAALENKACDPLDTIDA